MVAPPPIEPPASLLAVRRLGVARHSSACQERTAHLGRPPPSAHRFPEGIAFTDVPDDQAEIRRISFDRSGCDFADEPTYRVTGSQIYQRVGHPGLPQEVNEVGTVPEAGSLEEIQPFGFRPGPRAPPR